MDLRWSSATAQNRMLALLAVLVATAATGEAIHCYKCVTLMDPNCGDPFTEDGIHKVECTPDVVHRALSDVSRTLSDTLSKFGVDIPSGTTQIDFVCQKIKYTDSKGVDVVMRSCAFSPETVNSCPPEDAGAQCLQCSGDLCNAAPSLAAHGPWLVAFVLLASGLALRLVRP